MQLVVADTGPLHYLILIDAADILPRLFTSVLISERVRAELDHTETPLPVRHWIAAPPTWLAVRPVTGPDADVPLSLHPGERDAIVLARVIAADLLLMDDRAGVTAARRLGMAVTGTLGLLALAHEHGLLDLATAFARLRGTSFRYRPELMAGLLAKRSRPAGGE